MQVQQDAVQTDANAVKATSNVPVVATVGCHAKTSDRSVLIVHSCFADSLIINCK